MRGNKVVLFAGVLILSSFLTECIGEWIRQAEQAEQMIQEKHIRMARWDAWSGSIERVKERVIVNPIYVKERYLCAYEAAVGLPQEADWQRESLSEGKCHKRELYLIGEAVDGRKYYHRKGCQLRETCYPQEARYPQEACYRMEECAERGADPCPFCIGTVDDCGIERRSQDGAGV